MVVEMVVPGFILIFFAAGCWISGLTVWLIPVSLSTQITVFILSSLALLFSLRKYSLKTFRGSEHNVIDDHYADSTIGKTAVVTKTISPNLPGEIKILGSFWRATSDFVIEKGQSVVVLKKDDDGLTFIVKPS